MLYKQPAHRAWKGLSPFCCHATHAKRGQVIYVEAIGNFSIPLAYARVHGEVSTDQPVESYVDLHVVRIVLGTNACSAVQERDLYPEIICFTVREPHLEVVLKK